MVLVVAQHDLPGHVPTSGHAMMHRALKLSLMALSFAIIRFLAVIRHTVKVPLL